LKPNLGRQRADGKGQNGTHQGRGQRAGARKSYYLLISSKTQKVDGRLNPPSAFCLLSSLMCSLSQNGF